MYNILITGGAGFIGTHLAKKLLESNNVIILDLKEKFQDIHNEFSKVDVDIRNYENFNKLKGSFDYIFHLAAQTSGRISQENPELDIDTNVKGTMNVLRFAKEREVKKVIFTSSMAVYGNGENLKEDYKLNPLSHYGVSKVTGEYLLKMYNQFGIDYTIFRLFNVYGKGQDLENLKQGMVSIYLAQLLKYGKIEVTGSLERYRDFVYISDVINALVLGLEQKTSKEIFNVGSGKKTTVKELIDLLLEIDGRNIDVMDIGGHEGDQFGTYANIDKLKKLGWKPNVTLKEGLQNMYNWAKGIL
jgi:UDP-glucose 4-epimerase